MHSHKKLFVICLFLIFFLPFVSQAESIKIGILPVIDTLPLQVAKAEGFFKEVGLDVKLVRFSSAMERNITMQSNQLDGCFGDIPATLLLVQSGIPVKILTVSYYTVPGQRMFGLLLSSKYNGENSHHIDVAISKGSIIEYLLDQFHSQALAKKFILVPKEIQQLPVRMQLLAAGKIDSAILPEPLLTIAESKGAKLLITDEQLDIPLTVLSLNQSKLHLKQNFLKAYAKAVKALKEHPGKYKELMIKTCRIPQSLADKFINYQFPMPQIPSEREISSVQQWMVNKGYLKEKIPYQQLIR
ncbi:MAG: ABC transporter substrate-binding protein [Desulfobacteraceae bacterium]|nr:ABC transporter substrate-binding protein [Desulfobacteraceae bacterium]